MVHISLPLFSTLLSAYLATAAPTDDILGAVAVVTGFEQIANLTGVLYSQQVNPTPDITYAEIEKVLFNMTKTIDSTSDACKVTKVLDGNDAKRTEKSIADTAASVASGTTVIHRNINSLKQRNETAADTTILLNLASGYDKVYHACETVIPSDLLKFLGATFVTIICDLNEAAEALTPGSKLVDAGYCGTFKKSGNHPKHPHPKHPHPAHPHAGHPHSDVSNGQASDATDSFYGTQVDTPSGYQGSNTTDATVDDGQPIQQVNQTVPLNQTTSFNQTITQNQTTPDVVQPNGGPKKMARVPIKLDGPNNCSGSGSGSIVDADVLNCSNINILTGKRPSLDDLKNCPDVAMPSLPKKLKGFEECKQNGADLLKFAYQNNIWDDQASQFCSPTALHPDWKPCTKDWQPQSWLSDSKAGHVLN